MAGIAKYLSGDVIRSIGDLSDHIDAGGYVINAQTQQRIHPAWVASWKFRMVQAEIRKGSLLRALPNPDHPDHRKAQ